jgi:nucleoside-diphosphate-sugar epimerase
MSVLITGAGLIGVQIARLEQEAGREPVVFDVAPNRDALSDFLDMDRCAVVKGDVLNPLDLVAAVTQHGVRRIVHTAALGGLTMGSRVAPLVSTHVNVVGSANVLEVARVLELERVVLASSTANFVSSVGGEDEGAYSLENAYPHPTSIYAANKLAAEHLGLAYQATFGLDVLAVRYAAVFGPWRLGGGGGPTAMMESWLRAAIAGKDVEIGPGPTDWIYSKDAARGTYLACWTDQVNDRVFNLGVGESYGPSEIATALRTIIPDSQVRAQSIDAPKSPAMNIERAKEQLGYRPEFLLGAALADYREWVLATTAN